MRHTIVCLTLLFLTVCSAFSQRYDSLFAAISQHPKDSNQVKDLLALARKFQFTDSVPPCLVYSQQLAHRIGYTAGEARAYNQLGNRYVDYGEWLRAKTAFDRALFLFQQIGDTRFEAVVYNNIGNLYLNQDKLSEATEYFLKALHTFENLPTQDTAALCNIYGNLVLTLSETGYESEAATYAEKKFLIGRNASNPNVRADAFITKAYHLLGTEGNEYEAYVYAKQAYELVENSDNILKIVEAALQMEPYYLACDKHDSALYLIEKVLPYAYESEQVRFLGSLLFRKGLHYLSLQQLDSAEANLLKAEAICIEIEDKEEQKNVCFYLTKLYVQKNDPQKMGIYFQKYVRLNDALHNSNIQKQVAILEKRYQTAKKDKEIADLSSRQSRNRLWILGLTLTLLFLGVSAVFTIVFLRNRTLLAQNKIALHRAELQSLEREKEIATINAGIAAKEAERSRVSRDLHDDLGSTLTSLRFWAEMLKEKEGNDTTILQKIIYSAHELGEKVREEIWILTTKEDSLSNFIAYIRAYSVAYLLEKNIECTFVMPNEIADVPLSGEYRRNIFLVIKEALHNIVKHSGANTVLFQVDIAECVAIYIHDNGSGFDFQGNTKGGNGLFNIKKRMELVGGTFEIQAESGTKITLQFNANHTNV